jgi:hypothetical protein
MGIWAVQEWSVREADRSACMEKLQVIADHIREDHPECTGVRARAQWVGAQAHRGIRWEEHFESLTAMEEAPATPTCFEVWAPILAMTMPGTHVRSVLLDSDIAWER